jgi:hypothetical protein
MSKNSNEKVPETQPYPGSGSSVHRVFGLLVGVGSLVGYGYFMEYMRADYHTHREDVMGEHIMDYVQMWVPIFVLTIFLETLWAYLTGRTEYWRVNDMIGSMGTGTASLRGLCSCVSVWSLVSGLCVVAVACAAALIALVTVIHDFLLCVVVCVRRVPFKASLWWCSRPRWRLCLPSPHTSMCGRTIVCRTTLSTADCSHGGACLWVWTLPTTGYIEPVTP